MRKQPTYGPPMTRGRLSGSADEAEQPLTVEDAEQALERIARLKSEVSDKLRTATGQKREELLAAIRQGEQSEGLYTAWLVTQKEWVERKAQELHNLV